MNSLQWFGIIAIIMGIVTLTIPFVVPPQSSQFDYITGVIPTTITPNYEIFPITYWASRFTFIFIGLMMFTFIFIGLMMFLINTFAPQKADSIGKTRGPVCEKSRTDTWVTPKIEHGIPTKWNWIVSRPENLTLGKRVDIGAFTYIMAGAGIIIEDDVQIGSHCSIYSMNTIDNISGKIHIKKGVCIGTHSVILPKKNGILTIGENAKCGAFSLIKGDVRPNAIVKSWVKRKPIFTPPPIENGVTPDDITDSEMFMEEQEGRSK